MSIVSEIRLTVTKTINCGNYENVKIEGGAVVGKNDDNDTPESMRVEALDEVLELIKAAFKDHVPQRRQRSKEEKNEY